jgi:hypothetical protein
LGIVSGGIGRLRRRGTLLLFCGDLDRAEDRGYFTFESAEFEVDNAAPGMKNDIYWGVERRQIVAYSFAHTALDAVAINCLAHYLANSETDARALGVCAAQQFAIRAELRAQGEKVRHLFRELFAAGLVNALIVSVFSETEGDSSGGHTAWLDLKGSSRA